MKKACFFALSAITFSTLYGWGTQESNVSGDKKHSINFYGTLETWANPGKKIKIENISIDNLYKQIPLYVKPATRVTKAHKKAASNTAQDAAAAAKKAAKAAVKAAKMTKNGNCEAALEVAKAAQAAAEAATEAAKAVAKTAPIAKTTKANEYILRDDPEKSLIKAKIDLLEVDSILVPHPEKVWSYQKEKGYRKTEYIELVIISGPTTKKTKMHYLIDNRKKIYCDRITSTGPEEQSVPLKAIKQLRVESYRDREKEKVEQTKNKEREIIKKLSRKKTTEK